MPNLSIVERLLRLLKEHGARGPITPRSTLPSLGFDDLDHLEVMMAITEEFGTDVDFFQPRDLEHLVQVLHRAVGGASPGSWETAASDDDRSPGDTTEDVSEPPQLQSLMVEYLVGARKSPIGPDEDRSYARLLVRLSDHAVHTPPAPEDDLAELLAVERSDPEFIEELEDEFRVRLGDGFTIRTVSEVLADIARAEPFVPSEPYTSRVPSGLVHVAVHSQLAEMTGTTAITPDDTAATLGLSEEQWQTFLNRVCDRLSLTLDPDARSLARSVLKTVYVLLDVEA